MQRRQHLVGVLVKAGAVLLRLGAGDWLVATVEQIVEADATGLQVLLGHGTADTITAPRGSEWMAKRLRDKGTDVTLELVDGENHALLRKARWWHRRVTAYVIGELEKRIA